MDNFESKIQSLLSSPDGMNQVLSIARNLMGNASGSEGAAPSAATEGTSAASAGDFTAPSPSDTGEYPVSDRADSGEVPAQDVSADANAALPAPTQASGGGEDILSVLSQVDPAVMRSVMGLISEYRSTDDRRFHLLDALRPYVKSGDAAHIDKAMQIMRLSKVVKRVFSLNLGGGDAHV